MWERDARRALESAAVVAEGVAIDSMDLVPANWAALKRLDSLPRPSDSAVQRLFGQAFELYRVRVVVDRVWKGDVPDTLTVFTGEPGGGCGFGFVRGQRYLLFLHRAETGNLNASYCSLSRQWERADALVKELGSPIRRRAA
jgi:hypothetical protein